jgi:hypothetical protein
MTEVDTIIVEVVVRQPQMSHFDHGANEEPASSTTRMLMACLMAPDRAMAICSSISLELDEDIMYVLRE